MNEGARQLQVKLMPLACGGGRDIPTQNGAARGHTILARFGGCLPQSDQSLSRAYSDGFWVSFVVNMARDVGAK
jgi:hypothetical protein